ncbi:MAG TPA: MerR family transcriptional regulator [Gemmatimonadales bacterium]|nr:MerR family transcriptional regulator [Gemmatimonadales bacterium]
MTAAVSAPISSDPLALLREYRALAPWGLRDLSALAGGILDASGIVPVSSVARSHPTERTIRFYVTRGLVSPPEGRGTAATYGYRHLLQVLAIKLRQMEGATLETIVQEAAQLTGDAIERRVAATLGPRLPRPAQLPLLRGPGTARGRVGRALHSWLAPPGEGREARPSTCRRIPVGPGVELLIDDRHPVLRLPNADAALAAAVSAALAELQPHD